MEDIIIAIHMDIPIGEVMITGIIWTDHILSRVHYDQRQYQCLETRPAENITGETIADKTESPCARFIHQRAFYLFSTLLLFSISQYLQHALRSLLFCIYPINQFSISIIFNDHCLGEGIRQCLIPP